MPSIPQLIEDLELFGGTTGRGRRPSLNAELIELGATARAIAEELVRGRGTVDELVAATGHSVATVLGALTMLETAGPRDERVRPLPTGRTARDGAASAAARRLSRGRSDARRGLPGGRDAC